MNPITTAISTPDFVRDMLDNYHARRGAFILQHEGDLAIDEYGVAPIESFVPDFILRQGFEIVVTYCLSKGVRVRSDVDDRRELERIHSRIRQLCGLRLEIDDPEGVKDGRNHQSVEETLRGLDRLLKQSAAKVALVILNVDRVTPQPGVAGVQPHDVLAIEEMVESWGSSAEMRATDSLVVAMTRDIGKVSEVVRRAYVPLSHPLPHRDMILDFLYRLDDASRLNPSAFGTLEETVTRESFANVAAGLRLCDIEAIFRDAAVKKQPVNLHSVRAAKAIVINELAEGGLELMEPLKNGFAGLAGIDHIVPDLHEVGRLFRENPLSGNLPRGILLVGPPGTGKTSIARALAGEAGGINVVALGEVMGSYVGESERKMDNVLRVIEGMAPVIVFVDEVDTAFVSRGEASGDSGTSKRVLGKVLKALGDERLRGKALFILASNRGDLIDSALLRRCQKVYLVSTPGLVDRKSIFMALAKRDGRTFNEGISLDEAARLTDGCSGADLEKILARAAEIADREGRVDGAHLTEPHVLAAIGEYKSNRDEQLHEFFDLVGIRCVPFLPGIPWFRPGHGFDSPDCPQHVRRVLTTDGELDVRELNRRISELSALGGQLR